VELAEQVGATTSDRLLLDRRGRGEMGPHLTLMTPKTRSTGFVSPAARFSERDCRPLLRPCICRHVGRRHHRRSHLDGGGTPVGRGRSQGSPRSWGIRRSWLNDLLPVPCLSTPVEDGLDHRARSIGITGRDHSGDGHMRGPSASSVPRRSREPATMPRSTDRVPRTIPSVDPDESRTPGLWPVSMRT
jgi:hypothetical protein